LSFSCVVNIRNECYAFDAKKIEVDLMTLTLKMNTYSISQEI